MEHLHFSFLPKSLTFSSPLLVLVKAVGRSQIYEELPEGFIVPLFIIELPNFVMAHIEEEDSICVGLG